jgi:hypothetical protein
MGSQLLTPPRRLHKTLSSRYQRITVVGERQTEGAALEAV